MELLILSVCCELKRTIAWKCYNYPVRILSLFMLQYLYTGIWHASFALLLVAFFFLTHSRKCRFCLHWNFVVMRVSIALVQGLLMILWRVSFYSVKLCLLFVLHICLQLNQADLQCFSGKGAFFFLKGKLKITAEYWKPVKYLESIWRLS